MRLIMLVTALLVGCSGGTIVEPVSSERPQLALQTEPGSEFERLVVSILTDDVVVESNQGKNGQVMDEGVVVGGMSLTTPEAMRAYMRDRLQDQLVILGLVVCVDAEGEDPVLVRATTNRICPVDDHGGVAIAPGACANLVLDKLSGGELALERIMFGSYQMYLHVPALDLARIRAIEIPNMIAQIRVIEDHAVAETFPPMVGGLPFVIDLDPEPE